MPTSRLYRAVGAVFVFHYADVVAARVDGIS